MKQAFEATNENIQSIADRFEISNLLLDLAAAIDSKDINALKDIFTPDAMIDYTVCGGAKGPYHECMKLLEKSPPRVISNAEVCIDGSSASATTLCRVPHAHSGRTIYYIEKLRRTNMGWRIIEHARLA